ncbi:MAG TPA: hypothetical protein VGN57_21410 [Pirellulaceae bacterium]|jgi:hypothetical protein|nr:hypothetical protein [Pirellulaceae bacterium]
MTEGYRLFAAVTSGEQALSTGAESGNAAAFMAFASIAAFVLAVGALVAYAMQVRRSRPLDNHAALFRDLCNAHRLDQDDRETLLDAAAAAGVRGIEVFVRPETLSDLADRVDDPATKSRCWALRRRLFGAIERDRDYSL